MVNCQNENADIFEMTSRGAERNGVKFGTRPYLQKHIRGTFDFVVLSGILCSIEWHFGLISYICNFFSKNMTSKRYPL